MQGADAAPAPRADRLPGWRWYAQAALVLLLGLLLIRLRVNLAGGGGWFLQPSPDHPYPLGAFVPALVLLAGVGALVGLLVLPRREQPLSGWRAAAAVLLLLMLTALLQVTGDWGRGPLFWVQNAIASTWSNLSNGYFFEALKVRHLGEWLGDYHEIQRTNPMKLGTHPPGAVIAYWVPLHLWLHAEPLQRLSEAAVELFSFGQLRLVYGMAMEPPNVPRELGPQHLPVTLFCLLTVAWAGASAVIPTYLLGASGGSRRRGVLAAAVLAVCPNVAFYALTLDGLLMCLAAWALVGVVYAERAARPRWLAAAGAGVALGLGLLISLQTAATVVLAVAYLVVRAGAHVERRRPCVLLGLAVLAGVALVLVAVSLAGLRTATVFAQCLQAHHSGGGGIGHRAYLPWLLFNLVDYVALAGIPLAWAAVEAVLRRDAPGETLRSLAVATFAVLLLLNFSGAVKGETERLWLFLNPPLAAVAAAAAAGRPARAWPLACLPLQWLLLALSLPPLVRPY